MTDGARQALSASRHSLSEAPTLRTPDARRQLAVGEVVEMLDSDKILAQSAPPGAADQIALAFPRSARVDRLADEPGRSAAE